MKALRNPCLPLENPLFMPLFPMNPAYSMRFASTMPFH
jgi:hypothetical protein